MSSGPDPSNWYWQGIRRAEQEGLIHYGCKRDVNRFAVSDDYGHIRHDDGATLLLKYTNTRPLSFIARQILTLYQNDTEVQFLELGPGAGVACATAGRLLPDAKIDTVSLTPLNPYLRFRWDDVYDYITEPVSCEEFPLRLHALCNPAFVRNQYIGKFPLEISPPKTSYHLVYDNHGPIFCNLVPGRDGDPMELARASIAAALSLLRFDGTMLIMASDGWHVLEDALEEVTTSADVIVTCKRTAAYHSFPCIVARNESPLSMRLREGNRGLLSKSERILRLDSQTLEEIISRICQLRQ